MCRQHHHHNVETPQRPNSKPLKGPDRRLQRDLPPVPRVLVRRSGPVLSKKKILPKRHSHPPTPAHIRIRSVADRKKRPSCSRPRSARRPQHHLQTGAVSRQRYHRKIALLPGSVQQSGVLLLGGLWMRVRVEDHRGV